MRERTYSIESRESAHESHRKAKKLPLRKRFLKHKQPPHSVNSQYMSFTEGSDTDTGLPEGEMRHKIVGGEPHDSNPLEVMQKFYAHPYAEKPSPIEEFR